MYRPEEVDDCRAALEPRADLTKYGSWFAAGDLEHVRQALGYEQLDIWALSYGTMLAQIYMKRFPEAVRSAFLVGATEMDDRTPLFHAVAAQRVLDLILFECQSEPRCRRAYPDLRNDWNRVLARLDQGPIKAVHTNPASGEEQVVEIRRGPFGEAFRSLLSSAASQRRVPHLIHRMAAGDFAPFVAALSFGPSAFAEGLYLSIACSEDSPRITPEDSRAATSGTFLGDWRVRQQMEACARWPTAPLPPGLFDPLTVDVPVIVLAADMDHVAPWSRRVCDGLPRCRVLAVPHLGHVYFDADEWIGGQCFDRISLDLLRKGDVEAVDASCLRAVRPPPFTMP